MTVFLATLGQRPQAVTMALDILLPRYHYQLIGLLHTEPAYSGIASAYEQLNVVLEQDFGEIPRIGHELRHENGDPLFDITDLRSAEGYFGAVADVMRHYRSQNIPIHLLVAGGRKAMSIYATLAAALCFGENDRVWTILSSPNLMESKEFHIPRRMQGDVHLVNLPLLPSRLLPGVLADKGIKEILASRKNPRQHFLDELSREENTLIEQLRGHPYASNQDLGKHLNKSAKTVENQFRSIYTKMGSYFDLGVSSSRKRQILLDVIAGRI